MKFSILLFLTVFGMNVLTGCSTLEVDSDWDTHQDFSGFKTYNWVYKTQPKTGNPLLDNDLLDSRIRGAIDETLAGKGYQKVDTSTPDFWVHYAVTIKSKTEFTQVPAPMYAVPSGGRRGGAVTVWGGFDTFVSQYEEGTLLIDIANPQTKKLIWRGRGTDAVEPKKSPDEAAKEIKTDIQRILADFPPPQKAGAVKTPEQAR